ncbi:MAG: signal peptidase I [Dehalogenimonas sp.]|uniref:Signal peptidase I n=1 Tax=Candidatus Dehalogenimonas loeffleri TaxID=3127115 RepID=A0ABZ2J3H2_9CHLR|nr:signal peptidase I [Dehalogenimonas sp.]
MKAVKAALIELAYILVGALAIFILFQFTLQNSIVDGSSMAPNMNDADRLLVSKVAYTFGEPERGDIIVFPSPYNDGREFIKRIIGMPGETVEVIDGYIYINDQLLDEPYIVNRDSKTLALITVPAGEYYVRGDNRPVSLDSSQGWTIKRDDIHGKAWIVFWPLGSFGGAPNHTFEDVGAGALLLPLLLWPGRDKA